MASIIARLLLGKIHARRLDKQLKTVMLGAFQSISVKWHLAALEV